MTAGPSTPAPRRLTLADPTIGAEEIDAVREVLESRWLSAGPVTAAFERDFAAALGVPDAVAVSSGTAALHLAVMALGLGPGDEVIVPSLSFVASAAVTALCGATPVFADVRSELDLTIAADDVARLVTPRTRAIVAMHYGGFPCDLEALAAVARDSGASLIEDAAHAPVVRAGAAMLGTAGAAGCFSLYVTKNVTAGEGGMVVARDAGLLGRARALRSHAMARSDDPGRQPTGGYDVTGLGLNYRPTEISSAIGRVQLGRLPDDRARRRSLVAVYREALAAVPGLVIPFADRQGDSAHHLMAVLLPPGIDRADLQASLAASGVQTSVHYPPTHLFSFYRRTFPTAGRRLPVTESVAGRLLSMPLHGRMLDEDAAHAAALVVAACREGGV
jgi:dTDP-4-amino-4,6-dideoxygalactose transaminase